MTRTDAYHDVTSITGFDSVTKDPEKKIDEYLEFSNTQGYKIKKSGWYFVWMSVQMQSTVEANGTIEFYCNGSQLQWCAQGVNENDGIVFQNDAFPIYLNKDDVLYFKSAGKNTPRQRLMNGFVYPMF